MSKRIIALSIAALLAGITHISFCTKKKFSLPGTMKLVEQPIKTRNTTTGFLELPPVPTPVSIETTTTVDPSTKLPLETAINKKIGAGMPYILAVAITKDAKGNYDWHTYDPQSVRAMWQAHPIRDKTTKNYGFNEKASGLPIVEIYYYKIDRTTDPEFTFLCTGKEALENSYTQVNTAIADAFQKLVNATDKKTSDDALATIQKSK